MRALMSVTLVAAVAGCAWPVAPTFDEKEQANGTKVVYPLNVYGARSLLANWEKTIQSAAGDRRTAELVMEELTFYGTLIFTAAMVQISHAGGAAQVSKDVLHARNVGAAAAAGSQLLGSHYKLSDQRIAFAKAADRLKCARQAIAPLNPAVRIVMTEDYIRSVNEELQKAGSSDTFESLWTRVPAATLHFVENQVNPDLKASLQAITLSTPSKTELAALVDNWKQAAQVGGKAAGNASDPKVTSLVALYNTQKALGATQRTPTTGTRESNEDAQASEQRKEDQSALEGKSEVELRDMRKAFVVALVEFSSALSLCK